MEDSYDWCFDGVPKHSQISISTVGGFGNHQDNKKSWLDGYEKCLEVLDPTEIILFGKHFPEIRPYGKMTVVGNNNLIRKKTLSTRPIKGPHVDIPVVSDNEFDRVEEKDGT